MAIKNTLLNGADWNLGEHLINTDLNDTIEALYNYVRGL